MPFDSHVQYHELTHMLSQGTAEGSMQTTGPQVIIKLLDDARSSVNGLWAQICSNVGSKSQLIEVTKVQMEMGTSSTPTLSPTGDL